MKGKEKQDLATLEMLKSDNICTVYESMNYSREWNYSIKDIKEAIV
jgi:hypothetical protein